MSFPEHLRDRLRRIPVGPPPAPWRQAGSFAIGGLTEIGFAEGSDRLLVVSSQGRGLFDCLTGTRIARDSEPPDDGWYDEFRLIAKGIGPLDGRRIRLAGLHGGGLPNSTSDGWSATRIAPDWPSESVVLDPPGSYVLVERHSKGSAKIADGHEVRAWGFSETGLSLVVAASDHLDVWSRPGRLAAGMPHPGKSASPE